MEESNKQELLRFLNIFQHLGSSHLKTLHSFIQRPVSTLPSSGAQGATIPLFENAGGDEQRASRQTVFKLMQTLEQATDDQIDHMVMVITKQLRQQLDQNDVARVVNIASSLNISLEFIEAIGKLYQSSLVYEALGLHLSEDHLSKITDALVSVFPLTPLEDPMQQTPQYQLQENPETQIKIQNYLVILQKLQQLFTTTRIDSILHLHQEITHNMHNQHANSYQVICETLDLKSDEYFLATSLKSLLYMDESSLMTLIDAFPKLKSLQLAQLSHLPFKNIYEVLELRSNLVNLTSSYGYYPNQNLIYTFPIPQSNNNNINNNSTTTKVKIIEQPPEKAVYKRNVKPAPSVMFDGDSKLLDGSYYIACTLLRCNNFQEEPTFLMGNKPVQVGSSKVVSFKKLKILVTSHQQGETLFCFRFDLRRHRSDVDSNPNDFEVISSIHSNPICLLSHSTQLKHTANVDLPQVVEAIPLSGTSNGGTRVAILGGNFADTPATRIKFDNAEVISTFHSQGTLLCYTPEHAPGNVQVRVSNSPKHWSSSSAVYTYEDERTIAIRNAREDAQLHLPKSSLGIDFLSTFTNGNFIIVDNNSSLGSGGGAMRHHHNNNHSSPYNRFNLTKLDERGYALVHYLAVFSEVVPMYADLLKELIVQDCSVANIQDKHGNTALHWSAMFECVGAVALLLSAGASPNVQNHDGSTPMHVAVSSGNLDVVRMMLSTRRANLEIADVDGSTAMHVAASSKCHGRHIVALLLACGANMYAVDDEQETALHHAVRHSNNDVVAYLLGVSNAREKSYQSTVQVYPFNLMLDDEPFHSLQNEDGETALHLACATNNTIAIQLLVRSGARSDLMDQDGLTPLHSFIELINNNPTNLSTQDTQIILNILKQTFLQSNNNNNNNINNTSSSSNQDTDVQMTEEIVYFKPATTQLSNKQIFNIKHHLQLQSNQFQSHFNQSTFSSPIFSTSQSPIIM